MKFLKNIIVTTVIGLGLASCSNEAPFSGKPDQNAEGRFLTTSLSVNVTLEEALIRAESSTISVNDFTVDFIDPAHPSEKPLKTYKYGAMPEVVVLPIGTYQVRAYYDAAYTNSEKNAGFNAPFYEGFSQEFTIEQDKIVDNIKPIECKLANVKVTILFDQELIAKSKNSKVCVMVGNSGPLEFEPSKDDAGYFQYVSGSSTLTAEYTGVVEGEETREVKTKDDVQPGTHYKITFKLHAIDPNEPGNITPGGEGEDPIKIDATVNLEDLTGDGGVNIDPEEEEYLDDDRKPNEDPGPDDPGPGPVDPGTDQGPEITSPNVQLGVPTYVSQIDGCMIIVKSETGITSFNVVIDSNVLTPEELDNVGLTDTLDLVNPGEFLEPLQNFGFLDKETNQQSLGGEKEVALDISPFLSLLQMLGEGTHKFILTVGDDDGETTKTLILITEGED